MEKDIFELLREINVEENFSNSAKRHNHYGKHVITGSTRNNNLGYEIFPSDTFNNSQEYEKAADDLANTKLSKNVVGTRCMQTDKYLKYNKANGYLVIYTHDLSMPSGNLIYTFYKTDEEGYEEAKKALLSGK